MIWAILAFAFAALGSKILLSAWILWVFLPDRPECARCDGPTHALEARRGLRTIYRWCRMQHRWCPACGERFLARVRQPPLLYVGAPNARTPDPAPTPQLLERRPQ